MQGGIAPMQLTVNLQASFLVANTVPRFHLFWAVNITVTAPDCAAEFVYSNVTLTIIPQRKLSEVEDHTENLPATLSQAIVISTT
jgi:hypothetical protein